MKGEAESTVVPDRVEQAHARPVARCFVVHPPELVRGLDVEVGELVVGRAPGSDGVGIAHPTLSRRHLSVRWDPVAARHVAADLGSKNGSWVDGEPLAEAPRLLAPGAVIRVGEALMVYDVDDDGDEPADDATVAEAIPGASSAARALRAQVMQAAADPAPVLLVGETGTGKEHIAREIHRLSARPGPFCAVSCAELGPELIASQLFGHARGAFTGAQQAHPGLFRSAEQGTLLLDEIGELHEELQPKLLRVLQEREVLPLGETRPVPVDVRLIAATHRDVAALVELGDFRRDLYARLAFWEIDVPPLRTRRPDVLDWVHRLHARFGAARGRGDLAPLRLSVEAADAIVRASWPDNLRGLDRLVHRLAARARRPGETIPRDEVLRLAGDLAPPAKAAPAPRPQRREAPSREELEAAMARHGSVRAMAKHYGCDRRQIYRWLKLLGMR